MSLDSTVYTFLHDVFVLKETSRQTEEEGFAANNQGRGCE